MCHHLIGPTRKCDSLMCHLTDTTKKKKRKKNTKSKQSKQHRTFGGKIKIMKFQDVKPIHPKTSMMCFAPYGFILIYFSKL